jgi:hypothetical protein
MSQDFLPIDLAMDRREALKRLGVGGALAVTAPLLLDSFNVAHAVSGFVEEKLPDGFAALIDPPATTKSNKLTIEFNPDAFDREGPLWFYWTVLSAIPAITMTVDSSSSSAQIKKATGLGNVNSFTIEVEVWEDVGSEFPMEFVARYLVVSEGGLLTVTLQD